MILEFIPILLFYLNYTSFDTYNEGELLWFSGSETPYNIFAILNIYARTRKAKK